jgi:hypothetical protein
MRYAACFIVLYLCGCATQQLPHLVEITVDLDGDWYYMSAGFPIAGAVMTPAHTGKAVAQHLNETTLSYGGKEVHLSGQPVFGQSDDWCLLFIQEELPGFKIASAQPSGPLYILLPDGTSAECRPAKGDPRQSDPKVQSSQPSSQPDPPYQPKTCGRHFLVTTDADVGPGTSGCPVLWYNPRFKCFEAAGMVIGGEQDPLLVYVVPLWIVSQEVSDKMEHK